MSLAYKQPPDLVLQPEKCKGCIWGCWRETRQYCSLQNCAKEGEAIAQQAALVVGWESKRTE